MYFSGERKFLVFGHDHVGHGKSDGKRRGGAKSLKLTPYQKYLSFMFPLKNAGFFYN
jgi:alpha-beta hydrolase superfamily lysophospholipase